MSSSAGRTRSPVELARQQTRSRPRLTVLQVQNIAPAFFVLPDSRKRKEPETCSGLFFFAPRVGLEPTTNSLHVAPHCCGRGLYHHPGLVPSDARRFPQNFWSTPLRDSLYTFSVTRAWLGIALLWGFPEFTSCCNPDYAGKLPFDRELLYH
jgi:hypothetical protein